MSKCYVDNEQNRKLGRVGLPIGSAVYRAGSSTSRSGDSLTAQMAQLTTSDNSGKVYKDNKLNRKLGRVGMPLRSVSQSSQSAKAATSKTKSSSCSSSSGKVYVDNDYNRKHNRVGKPLGSVPIPANTQVYKDTPLNRSLGRVGKPWGTTPNKKLPHADLLQKLMHMQEGDDFPEGIEEIYEKNKHAEDFINHYLDLMKREKTIRGWLEQKGTGWKAQSHLSLQTIEKYKGNVIPFEELVLIAQIGNGGFGVVHMAEWKDGEVVAVKKLNVERVSEKRRKQFEDEIALFYTLQHPNIVKFLGACVVIPDLAIVMEYMDMSLHEALHMKQVDFTEKEKLSIMRNVAQGIDYLHEKSIAHCDLKTQNVLLNNVPGQEITDSQEMVIAKITDFGLSMMKKEIESSASAGIAVSNIGTPRYSAPEVLRGELLNVEKLMKADVYSEGLLILELVVVEIAFEDLTMQQLRVQVGEKNMKPSFPTNLTLDKQLKEMLDKCWSSKPEDRPSSHSVCVMVDNIHNLFMQK